MQFTWTLYWAVFGICILATAGVLLLLAIRELQQGVEQLKEESGCPEAKRQECREKLLEAQWVQNSMTAAKEGLETTDQILDRMVAKKIKTPLPTPRRASPVDDGVSVTNLVTTAVLLDSDRGSDSASDRERCLSSSSYSSSDSYSSSSSSCD